jgi:two-component system LytT family response regulator
MDGAYRALIVDDEPIARGELRSLIGEVGWLTCVGEASTGDEAVRAIDQLRPDVVLLDVEMPGGSGLQVLQRSRHRPCVVFTTAYGRYAVQAFDAAALDYLVKPFGERRFADAVARVRVALDGRAAIGAGGGQPSSIFVTSQGTLVNVPASEIICLSAADDYVQVRTPSRSYLELGSLGSLADRLDPGRFLQVHRSHVVNRKWIDLARPAGGGRMEILLKDGTTVPASRRCWRRVRKQLV